MIRDENGKPRYFGKYDGIITDISDPLKMDRVKVRVPSILGEEDETEWARPCFPFPNFSAKPSVGDTCYVEFLEGDIDIPIVAGYWFQEGYDIRIDEDTDKDVVISRKMNLNLDFLVRGESEMKKKLTLPELKDLDDADIIVNGNVTMNDELTVNKDSKFVGDVDIAGELAVTKDVALSGELSVTKNVNVAGNITADAITANTYNNLPEVG